MSPKIARRDVKLQLDRLAQQREPVTFFDLRLAVPFQHRRIDDNRGRRERRDRRGIGQMSLHLRNGEVSTLFACTSICVVAVMTQLQ